MKRDGCTQAIVEPLCEEIMLQREMGDLIIVKLLGR